MLRDRRRGAGLVLLVCVAVLVVTPPALGDDGPSPTPVASPGEDPTPSTPPVSTESDAATPSETPSAEPSETPSEAPTPSAPATTTTTTTVTDAELRWGVNNESNNRANAPRTFNFFSAGLLADPGRGGVAITEPSWHQSVGNTSVEKWNGSAWLAATWAGLGTDSTGAALGAPAAGTFSNHQIVMRGGTGTVDAASGDAHVTWDADVSVLYYSGMSFFHLSDPVLDLVDGVGRLTATVDGFASSQNDPDLWSPVPAQVVTLADLPAVSLADTRGLIAQPAYLGVRVSGVPQVTGASSGSFPQSFVDYMGKLGSAAFWYSSGSATDPFKVPLPLAVSYDAAHRVDTAAPPAALATTTIENKAPAPPAARSVPLSVAAAHGAPAPVAVPAAPLDTALVPRPTTEVRLLASPTATAIGARDHPWAWWTGGALLLATALLLLVPAARTAAPPKP